MAPTALRSRPSTHPRWRRLSVKLDRRGEMFVVCFSKIHVHVLITVIQVSHLSSEQALYITAEALAIKLSTPRCGKRWQAARLDSRHLSIKPCNSEHVRIFSRIYLKSASFLTLFSTPDDDFLRLAINQYCYNLSLTTILNLFHCFLRCSLSNL